MWLSGFCIYNTSVNTFCLNYIGIYICFSYRLHYDYSTALALNASTHLAWSARALLIGKRRRATEHEAFHHGADLLLTGSRWSSAKDLGLVEHHNLRLIRTTTTTSSTTTTTPTTTTTTTTTTNNNDTCAWTPNSFCLRRPSCFVLLGAWATANLEIQALCRCLGLGT